jgi:hypothetical protein
MMAGTYFVRASRLYDTEAGQRDSGAIQALELRGQAEAAALADLRFQNRGEHR